MTDKTRPVKKPTPSAMRSVATKLVDYLSEHELFEEVRIYADGELYSSEKTARDQTPSKTPKGNTYYMTPNVDMCEYVETADSKTIAMTFEGPLYDLINYEDYDFVYKLTQMFVAQYGLYFEMINAFTLAAYEA